MTTALRQLVLQGVAICSLTAMAASLPADEKPVAPVKPVAEQPPPSEEQVWKLLQEEFAGARALNPQKTVLIQVTRKQVLLKTKVACPDCILEMVLVPEGNREHETILSIRTKAFVIHAALLAIGMEPGKPATFSPDFVPPSGPVVDIEAVWGDAAGKIHRLPLKEWVRFNTHKYHAAALPAPPEGIELPHGDLRWDRFNNELLWYGPMTVSQRDELLGLSQNAGYQKVIRNFYQAGLSRAMTADFVFAGSSIYKDEETGEEFYEAEAGHLICTSNFPDALIDLREQSSASDGAQTYEGWTERIPQQGTPVLLILSAAKRKTASDSQEPMPPKDAPLQK